MTPEMPHSFEVLRTAPFCEIAYKKDSANRVLTRKTKRRARNILGTILTENFGYVTTLEQSRERDDYISGFLKEHVFDGGRMFVEEDIDIVYSNGNLKFKQIIDFYTGGMTVRLGHTIPGQKGMGEHAFPLNGEVLESQSFLGGVLDILDLINLGDRATQQGITIIAESLHEQNVSPFDVGFGLYNLANPRFRINDNGALAFHTQMELRVDPENAAALRTAYLAQTTDTVTQKYFTDGEKSAQKWRKVLTTSSNQLLN